MKPVKQTTLNAMPSKSNNETSETDITLNLKGTINSHSGCILSKSRSDLQNMTLKVRSHVFV